MVGRSEKIRTKKKTLQAVFRIRIRRIHMFFALQDPDPLVRGMWIRILAKQYEKPGSGSISQRHGSADPDTKMAWMDPQHCLQELLRGSDQNFWHRSHDRSFIFIQSTFWKRIQNIVVRRSLVGCCDLQKTPQAFSVSYSDKKSWRVLMYRYQINEMTKYLSWAQSYKI